MSAEVTPEGITRDMLSKLEDRVDVREGSYTADLVAGAALELFKVYRSMAAAIPMFYVDETSGRYIDEQAGWYGIARKPGTHAEVMLAFAGEAGALVPQGSIFTTAGGLRFSTVEAAQVPGSAAARAVEPGERYNVGAGEITRQYVSVAGVTAVTNAEAAVGGSDAESDAALFARLAEYRGKPATSGNANHYRQWVLEVPGVGAARVTPLKNGAGTVGVLLVGQSGEPVEQSVVDACAAHIEGVRPVGASVEVQSAEALEINVAAAVLIAKSTTAARVKEAFTASLTAYLRAAAMRLYELPYHRIAYMLLDIEGVEDFTQLTVNGGTENIVVGEDEVPVVGSVSIE